LSCRSGFSVRLLPVFDVVLLFLLSLYDAAAYLRPVSFMIVNVPD